MFVITVNGRPNARIDRAQFELSKFFRLNGALLRLDFPRPFSFFPVLSPFFEHRARPPTGPDSEG